MNVRLKKEFKGLMWPWLAAALIGLLPFLSSALISNLSISLERTVYSIAASTYLLAVVMLAAMLFGNEFQQRTLSLLLSQPCRLSTIWREKLLVTGSAVVLLTLFHIAGGSANLGALHSHYKQPFVLLPFLFSAAVFWSLITRSVLGGVVLSICSLALLYIVAWLILDHTWQGFSSQFMKMEVLLPRLSFFATPFFLWLGWHQLRRLQVTGDWDSQMATPARPLDERLGICSLQSRSDMPVLNLMLKEVRLLRPVFLIIFAFTLLWLAAAAGSVFRPLDATMFVQVMNGVSSFYIPFVIVLAGCVSLGAEKSLGIHATNLSSPISPLTQFLTKNLVATVTAFTGTVLLFSILSHFTGRMEELAVFSLFNGPLLGSVFISSLVIGALVQIALWSATVADRTIHAVFLSVISAIGMWFLLSFACSHPLPAVTNLVQIPLLPLMVRFQLSHVFLTNWIWLLLLGVFAVSAASFVGSAWKCFRRSHGESQNMKTAWVCPAVTIAFVGILTGALIEAVTFRGFNDSTLYQETKAALLSLDAHIDEAAGLYRPEFTSAQLIATGKLSAQTAAWLHNCTVKVNHGTVNGQPYSMALVFFPQSTWVQPIGLDPVATADMSVIEESIRKSHERVKPDQPL